MASHKQEIERAKQAQDLRESLVELGQQIEYLLNVYDSEIVARDVSFGEFKLKVDGSIGIARMLLDALAEEGFDADKA